MAYECLYCGKVIEDDQVLFVDETSLVFEDAIREELFRKCGMVSGEGKAKFNRLYHKVDARNVTSRDENGFPKTISVRPCDGLTAEELTQINVSVPVQEVVVEPQQEVEDDGFGSEAYDAFGSMDSQTGSEAGVNTIIKPEETEATTLSTRACPHCHCSLPYNFGLLPVHSVQIMGGRASGKTAYLICLHQQLNQQLSWNDLGTAELLEESKLYLNPKVDYYEKNGSPMPTPRIQSIFPLVYYITARHGREQKRAFISFHDVAGEGIHHGDYLHGLGGLARSRNLLYMIDPNQLNRGGYYAAYRHIMGMNNAQAGGAGMEMPAGVAVGNAMDFYETELSQDIASVGGLVSDVYGEKQPNNIFVVMTKMDMPLMVEKEMFAKGKMYLTLDIGDIHHTCINGDMLKRIDDELNLYVSVKTHSKSKRKLSESIAESFGCDENKIHALGISTHTRIRGTEEHPIMFANKYDSADPKHRIIEPFLCMLYHMGLLPAKFGDQIDWKLDQEEEKKAAAKDKKPRKGLFGRSR